MITVVEIKVIVQLNEEQIQQFFDEAPVDSSLPISEAIADEIWSNLDSLGLGHTVEVVSENTLD